MGACFDSVQFSASSNTELQRKFKDHQESMCGEQGQDSYAGHIGIVNGLSITSQVFKTHTLAEEWLENNTQKWESAKAVKVGDFGKVFPVTMSEKKMNDTFSALKEEINNWDSSIIKRVKAGKSAQKGCDKCGSKISIKHISTANCPVCGDHKFLKTETDDKKFAAMRVKLKDMETKISVAKKKYEKNAKETYWLVGAICPS